MGMSLVNVYLVAALTDKNVTMMVILARGPGGSCSFHWHSFKNSCPRNQAEQTRQSQAEGFSDASPASFLRLIKLHTIASVHCSISGVFLTSAMGDFSPQILLKWAFFLARNSVNKARFIPVISKELIFESGAQRRRNYKTSTCTTSCCADQQTQRRKTTTEFRHSSRISGETWL